MRTLAFWLIATTLAPAAGVAFLALLRIGIARQERASSLTAKPRGLSAALARRVLGLHAEPPCRASQVRSGWRERVPSTRGRKPGTP
jgi:hypothetical protein